MLGLFVFFYAVLHLLGYAWLDMGFELDELARDIAKRPFILVGFLAFVLLTALAVTSSKRVLKAMGAKRWQMLHRGIYLIAGLPYCISSGCGRARTTSMRCWFMRRSSRFCCLHASGRGLRAEANKKPPDACIKAVFGVRQEKDQAGTYLRATGSILPVGNW